MAGLDGIKNKIDPHANGWGPYDVNLYTLSDEEKAKLQGLPTSRLTRRLTRSRPTTTISRRAACSRSAAPQLHCRQARECAAMAAIHIPRNSNATTTCKKLRASIGDRLPAAPPLRAETTLRAARRQRRTIMEQVLLDQIIALRAQLTPARGLRPRGRDKSTPC